jgi:5-methylcytosine-specific restriction endonuclease McrA
MKAVTFLSNLSDRDLLEAATRLAHEERRATTELIAALAEVDARRLYLGEGCSSLFTYCVQVLHLSEHAAYGRIEAARAARKYPLVLDALAQGLLTLTTVTLLAPHLTEANHVTVLASAHRKSKRDVEQIVATLRPRPDAPAIVRKLSPPRLPAERAIAAPHASEVLSMQPPLNDCATQRLASSSPVQPDSVAVTPPRRPTIQALSPERFKVQFTVSRETHDKLRRAQDLLRHVVPDGNPAHVFDRALSLLLAHLEKQRAGAADRPRTSRSLAVRTRTIPAAVQRAVWQRDGGQCAYLGTRGRCTETGLLEYHHVVPFARGGATTADNIQLRCRAHNQHEARETFGARGDLFVRERADDPHPVRCIETFDKNVDFYSDDASNQT